MNTSRTLQLSESTIAGSAVIYVMARDQRVHDNHALLSAQQDALSQGAPLIVLFNYHDRSGVRSREHYEFMVSGLESVASELKRLHIPFVIRTGDAFTSTLDILRQSNASSIYFDFNPLLTARSLVKRVASAFTGSTYVVDTHNIIPAWVLSDKQEYAAHTIRRKVHKLLEDFVTEPDSVIIHPYRSVQNLVTVDFSEIKKMISNISPSGIIIDFSPGEQAARSRLDVFLADELEDYAINRNDFAHDHQSGFSPYLHFGHISSLRVVLETMKRVDKIPLLFEASRMASASDHASTYDGMNTLFEEMIVRKELADNFCFYNDSYLSIHGTHEWARKSLDEHRNDTREFTYSQDEWERARTHDPSWNAAQTQLRRTGKIHGYMRMYWAKKILEWSENPEVALKTAIYLNDRYSIDGGDPNGYAGILWSIAGLHDRPWAERAVFGKIRYMNAAGLRRKYDIEAYIARWIDRK